MGTAKKKAATQIWSVRTCRTETSQIPGSWKFKKIKRKKKIRPPFLTFSSFHRHKLADVPVPDGQSWSLLLAQLDLPGVGGEEEHDGEAGEQAGVLDGKGEEEAATARVLFLATHLIHLRELKHIKKEREGTL